ncbi:MAG: CBS domain-containing protein [Candidatus Saccharimonadales bacterium]
MAILILSALSVIFSILRRVFSFSAGKNLFGEELESNYQRIFTQISNNKNLLNAELWTLIVLASSTNLILIENYTDSWVSVFIFSAFIWLIFIYLANYQPRSLSVSLAKMFAPAAAKTASASKRYFKFIPTPKTGSYAQTDNRIYEKPDLIDFLQGQANAPNNKINGDLLKLLSNIAAKSDLQAGDIMTSLKKVKKIDSEQEIGPVVIDELHKSGSKYFLVEDKKENEMIGYVKLRDLTSLKSSGKIRGAVNKELDYVEITDDVIELIDAFLASSCPVFLIRDSGETVGVVTIDECLEKLLF